MTPAGDGRRFCSRCSKHVHFLSELTEAAASRVWAEHLVRRESLCVNYMSSSDGLIAFERPSMAITTWASLLLVGLGVMFVTACAEPNPIAMTVDESEVMPPLWVELEPESAIPDLSLPLAPAAADAERIHPAAFPARHHTRSKRTKRGDKRKPKLILSSGGDALGGP